VIGSHSASHPERISHLTDVALRDEWQRSTALLSELLSAPVTVASVPGGFYSGRVADVAESAGLRLLFTSEPVARMHTRGSLRLGGRYNITRSTPPAIAAALAAGRANPRFRQWLAWNIRKLAKAVGGSLYLRVRRRLLSPTG
jgi:peptidoglycan/xylan/chitin deacetylase (PgdA/CDA1 family)